MMHESDKSGDKVRGDGTQGYILKSRAARGLILGIEGILDYLIEMIILALANADDSPLMRSASTLCNIPHRTTTCQN
jgi:hypothetical protein